MAPHLFGHRKIYNMGVSISRHILPISHISLKIGSDHGMPCPSMVITLGTMDVGTEGKMLCHRKTHALHSKVIISSPDTWSTSYKQVSTMLTVIL